MRISDWSSDVCSSDLLGAGALQDATHDVDGRVVTVEQRGRSDEAHLVLGLVWLERRGDGKIGHDGIHFRRGREARTESLILGPDTGRRHARKHREPRSEEHTSELQSLMRISYAVFCLKKKKTKKTRPKQHSKLNYKSHRRTDD